MTKFGNIYTRLGNPTTGALEAKIANLEGGTMGVGVASGHAAQMICFHLLMEPGANIVAAKQLYGGSINAVNHSFKSFGWNVIEINGHDIEHIVSAYNEAKATWQAPTVIIANTTPGKGVDFMEDKYQWHSKPMTKEQVQEALHDLRTLKEKITSEHQ